MPQLNETNKAVNTYKSMQVQTANQAQLIVMLYEGAVKFLQQAKTAINNKKIDAAHNYIMKTQDIIIELMTSLNMEDGGKIAENLLSIYIYANKRLVEANIKKDNAIIDEVIKMLTDLLDSWTKLAEQAPQTAPIQQPAALPRGGLNIAG